MSVQRALGGLAEALIDRIDEVLDDYVVRLRAEVPDFFASGDPAVVDALRESTKANYEFAFAALRSGREVPVAAVVAAVAEARIAAEAGIALNSLLRSYYVGHSVAWEHIVAEVELLSLDSTTRLAVLQLTSRYGFSYIERVTVLVADEYTRTLASVIHSRGQRRARLVADLLEGLPTDEEALGYPLLGWHVAAITWGDRPDHALACLAESLGGPLLTLAGPFGTLWGWVGLEEEALEARGARYVPPAATRAALGAPAHGKSGFRRTHNQAQRARVVAFRTTDPVTHWKAVALEALMLHDRDAARAFAHEELGSLTGDEPRCAVLRQTLAAWFAAEHRAVGAAALLGVHERTVSYRLRTIEDRLGHPILARRTELDTALRLHDHCGLRDETQA